MMDPDALDKPEYFQSPRNYVFWLMGNEWITRVSYCLLPATETVCGMSFDTNFRQAQWVGTRTAVERLLTAPRGYCVSSLRGRKKDVWGYSEVGAVYRKRVDVATSTSTPRVQLEDKWVVQDPKQSGDSVVVDFRSVVTEDTVGAAVLLTVSDAVDKIKMLSSGIALNYRPWRGYISLVRGEHLMELLQDERITGVECKQNYGCICAIRFVTTHRVTPWFGRCPRKGEDALMISAAVTCGDDPGASIVGVFGSKSANSKNLML